MLSAFTTQLSPSLPFFLFSTAPAHHHHRRGKMTSAAVADLAEIKTNESAEAGLGMHGDDEMTPLQKHAAFFDRNNDGVIYPSETYEGFRAIGCSVALSAAAAVFINAGLAPKTKPEGKSLSPHLPIYVKNIKKGKHGSDSGVYDSEGRFVPSKFEEIFKKHALTYSYALTEKELKAMMKANREPKDYGGWLASLTEWKILYVLCKDKDGLLQKETVRAVYDGSLFLQLEKEKRSSKKKA